MNVVGVFLFKAAGANINDFELGGNSVYGIWIKGGKNNQVNCANTGRKRNRRLHRLPW